MIMTITNIKRNNIYNILYEKRRRKPNEIIAMEMGQMEAFSYARTIFNSLNNNGNKPFSFRKHLPQDSSTM